MEVEIMEPGSVARIAAIVGPSSAAAKALAEYKRRSLAGEKVAILRAAHSLIVGPIPSEAA